MSDYELYFKNKNCLVTGGAGFIGSNLSKYLVNIGANVTAIDNFSTGLRINSKDFSSLGIDLVEADITDQEITSKYFKNKDFVFHQAAIPSVPSSISNPVLTHHHNINGTLSVLENSRLYNIKKVIFAASTSAYGDTVPLPKIETINPMPLSPYAVHKLVGEYYCQVYFRCYNLRTTALRYFNVYGPFQDPSSEYSAVIPIFIKKALSNKELIIYGDGENTRDFVFVDDVIQANLQSAVSKNADGQVINVAYGDSITLNDLAKLIIDKTSSTSSIIYKSPRQGDIKHSGADLSLAESLLNYNPQYNLNKGLMKTIDYFISLEK